jgi:hypothetical protein
VSDVPWAFEARPKGGVFDAFRITDEGMDANAYAEVETVARATFYTNTLGFVLIDVDTDAVLHGDWGDIIHYDRGRREWVATHFDDFFRSFEVAQ